MRQNWESWNTIMLIDPFGLSKFSIVVFSINNGETTKHPYKKIEIGAQSHTITKLIPGLNVKHKEQSFSDVFMPSG